MASHATLIPELEQAIRHGSAGKRADMAARITDLFVAIAGNTDATQIALFDEVLGRLVDEIEMRARAAVSRQLAPIDRAPPKVVRRLAGDGAIEVAAPVLRGSQGLGDAELAAVARSMGPPHLLAIAQRSAVAATVADILVARGDMSVLQAVAANSRARLSHVALATLVSRAAGDDALAATVRRRADIPDGPLRRRIEQAAESVGRRTRGKGGPNATDEALANISAETRAAIAAAYRDAQNVVLALVRADKLEESAVVAFAANGQVEETVAAFSALSRLPIEAVDHILRGDRLDAILILGRAIGLEWQTVRAVIALGKTQAKGEALDHAKINFERLPRQGTQSVVQYWRDCARS
jgi:uncharacterized protein (DUF2336 family)